MFFWGRGKRAKRHRCKGKVQNTKWRKGYTGKSQISLLPLWITTVPVYPELKDLWEHGVFITKTGTVLSKQGQLATLSAPSFLLRGNKYSYKFLEWPSKNITNVFNIYLQIWIWITVYKRAFANFITSSYFLEIKLNLIFFIARVIQEVTKCSENKIKALTSLAHPSCCSLLPEPTRLLWSPETSRPCWHDLWVQQPLAPQRFSSIMSTKKG